MIDIIEKMHGTTIPRIDCLDYGFVEMWDIMPRLVPDGKTADYAITQAARLSYQQGTKTVSDDKSLIRFLARNCHTSPTEMVELKFHISMPIFSCRQMIRHRTANVNECSGRYSILSNKFYYPTQENVRKQSKVNKQMTEGSLEETDAKEFLSNLDKICLDAYEKYEKALESGVGRELARTFLPVNLYTEFVWKNDLHNTLHFLKLRCDEHSQYEIRVFADAMLELITPLVPESVQAWKDFSRDAVTYSRLENEKLKDLIRGLRSNEYGILNPVDISEYFLNSGNNREDSSWLEKLKKLGIE